MNDPKIETTYMQVREELACWWVGCVRPISAGAPWNCRQCTLDVFGRVRRLLGWPAPVVYYTIQGMRQLIDQYSAQVQFVPKACDHDLCSRGRVTGFRYCPLHLSPPRRLRHQE